VEVPAYYDDLGLVLRDALDLVAPLAGSLQRGLDGFGAGVHRQHEIHAGERGEFGAERPELIVVERPAREGEAIELRVRDGGELGVAVPEVQRAVRGEQGEVATPVDVADPRTVALRDHDGQGRVIAGAVRLDELDCCPGLR